jgi:hypothetical protein
MIGFELPADFDNWKLESSDDARPYPEPDLRCDEPGGCGQWPCICEELERLEEERRDR